VQYLKQYQKGVPFVAFKENGSLSAESPSVGERENELCSNGNREYLDDKTTIAAMLSSMSAYEVHW
jgi:hypothetical protein